VLLLSISRSAPRPTRSNSRAAGHPRRLDGHLQQRVGLAHADRSRELRRGAARPTGAPPRAVRRATAACSRRSRAPRSAPRAAGRPRRSPGNGGGGLPGDVPHAVVRHPCRRRMFSVHSAPRPWNWPIARRRRGGGGREQHVVTLQHAVQPARQRRLAGERAIEQRLRDQPAEPRHRARAPFQALG
jgi:hypothetical protein